MRLECDNCGKVTPHTKCGTANEHEEIDSSDDFPSLQIQWTHLLAQCEVCENVSLFLYGDYAPEEISRLYPIEKDLGDVPDEVRVSYREAQKVKGASPIAFSVMVRRTLEFVCHDKGAIGKDLKNKLDDLSSKGIIPDTLAKMSHVLRDRGNKGAHAITEKITPYEARTLDDFLMAVIEYVYIAPAKLQKLEDTQIPKNNVAS